MTYNLIYYQGEYIIRTNLALKFLKGYKIELRGNWDDCYSKQQELYSIS